MPTPRPHVFVIDADAARTAELREVLESAGFSVRRVTTAEEKLKAVEALLNDSPVFAATDAGADGLTGREREIVDMLANGARVVTIAQTLQLSPHTVRNHLKSVFRKLNLRGQHELFEHWKRRS